MTRDFRLSNPAALARRALVYGVSGAVLAIAAAPAFAQEAGGQVEEVVVTGSRIRQDGMRTPVPITVVNAAELKATAPATVIEAIGQLPQFYANQAPGSTANFFTRGGLGNLNIRGLGINRTLTLLNGRRVVSSNAFGGVDINLFPSDMIKSIETVTGGASAAYGTDAVAGVTNFILDNKFRGARLSTQGGITDRGDAEHYTVTGSFGTKLGARGHLLVSGEYFHQRGVHSYQGRDWYQGWGTIPDATGKLLIRPRIVSRNVTIDGMIIAAGSALNGVAFRPDGSTYQFVTSDTSFGALGAANARQSIVNGGSGDDIGGGRAQHPLSRSQPQERLRLRRL
jgi:outer membrane receptor protein involved in Fe transport